MQSVKATFNDRVLEIQRYYSFLDDYIDKVPNDDLVKILKSNLLLMLYNLVESSMSNAVEEIHHVIYSNSASFNTLKIPLRKQLIKFLKSHLNPNDFVININDIATDIVKQCFDKQKMFNGNIDGRKIRELSENYGFSVSTDYNQTKNGNCLVIIKGRRNDLAHGVFSFTEVGKDYSIEDLEKMKDETIHYLEEIIQNIESYLTNQDYIVAVAI